MRVASTQVHRARYEYNVHHSRICAHISQFSHHPSAASTKDLGTSNEQGSFMSNLLYMYEDEIIMNCVKRLKDINVEVCTLCFDGFLIKGVHTSNDL